jgi:CBS domain-containing protein
MPTVRSILAEKERQIVHSVSPDTRVIDAIQKMNQHKIGAVLVTQEGHIVGIFTERDVLRRVVGQDRSATSTTVGEVMTEDVICVPPGTDIDDVSAIMKQRRIRHVPVCDDKGTLHGIVSIGDINAYHASDQEMQIHFLHDYIFGWA